MADTLDWGERNASMATTILELKSANQRASALLTNGSYDKVVAGQVASALADSATRIGKLDGQIKLVQNNTLSYASWKGVATALESYYVGEGNIFQTLNASAYSFTRLYDEVIVRTVSDTKDYVKDVATNVIPEIETDFKWVTVLAGILLVFYVVRLFK